MNEISIKVHLCIHDIFELFDIIKQRCVKETGWPYGQQITNQIHLKILKYNKIKKISQYFSFEL